MTILEALTVYAVAVQIGSMIAVVRALRWPAGLHRWRERLLVAAGFLLVLAFAPVAIVSVVVNLTPRVGE